MDITKSLGTIIASLIIAVAMVIAFDGANESSGVGVPGVALYPQSVTTFTQGGGLTSTSSLNASETLLATDMDTENYIEVTPLQGAFTLTLPASTTFPGIPNVGDMRTFIIENAATAATNTTIAAGTGIDLQEPDGQNVVVGQNNYAVLTATRMKNTDIMIVVDEVIPAD